MLVDPFMKAAEFVIGDCIGRASAELRLARSGNAWKERQRGENEATPVPRLPAQIIFYQKRPSVGGRLPGRTPADGSRPPIGARMIGSELDPPPAGRKGDEGKETPGQASGELCQKNGWTASPAVRAREAPRQETLRGADRSGRGRASFFREPAAPSQPAPYRRQPASTARATGEMMSVSRGGAAPVRAASGAGLRS